jgi:hypothetical protein
MKMMDCSALEKLVVNHEPIELIDVRSKKEFCCDAHPGSAIASLGRASGAQDFSKATADDKARLCHFRRRSRPSQPRYGNAAIGWLRERRSGGWRNEGLGRPGLSSAAQEILSQNSGESQRACGFARDGSVCGSRAT